MIIAITSMRIAQGKRVQAIEWAKKGTNWLKERYPRANIKLMEEVLGDHVALHWTGEYDSLASWESDVAKRAADKEWQALRLEAEGLFQQDGQVTKGYKVIVG